MNKCRKLCKVENNCRRKTKSCGNLKPQPGKYAGNKPGKEQYKNRKYTCPDMQEKVLMDNYNDDLNLRSSSCSISCTLSSSPLQRCLSC